MNPQSNQSQGLASDEDLVQVVVKIYNTTCQDNEPTAFLVGERGMYFPKHQDHMTWIPKGLVYGISQPADDGTQKIIIPRWFAVKKSLKYRDP